MADAIESFFEGLGPRGPKRLPAKSNGSIRFDLAENGRVERWHVAIRAGEVAVSRGEKDADAIVRVGRELFGQIVAGQVGVVAAAFSGALAVEGSFALLVTMKRFFASPPGARDPRTLVDRGALS
nr:SCP2 sterol-binding domain-containing protein [Micromonospora sp. DSM 115978]